MKGHTYFVYMIASRSRVLYIGMTNNLRHRVWEHKNDLIDGFTKTHKCHRLVWDESYDDVANATDWEKEMKRWRRVKKDRLISMKKPTSEHLPGEGHTPPPFTPQKQQDPPRAQSLAK